MFPRIGVRDASSRVIREYKETYPTSYTELTFCCPDRIFVFTVLRLE